MDIERRRSARLSTELGTTCRVPATPHPATVLDVSLTGCRIRLAGEPLPEGATVNLDMRAPKPIQGRVMWTAGQSAGVRFDRLLPEATAVMLGLAEPQRPEPEHVEEAPLVTGLQHWIRKVLGWGIPAR